MSRPAVLKINTTQYWAIDVLDSSGVLVDADSTPTVAIRKNGASTADSVTVTKRASTTGIYDCSYNPASEASGDTFGVEETVTIAAQAYPNKWSFSITEDVTVSDILTGDISGYEDTDDTFGQAAWLIVNTVGTNVAAILAKFAGITLLAQWLGLLAGKQVGSTTARNEMRATGAGSGTYDETADSLEANTDSGDATLAKQLEIIALLAAGATIQSPVPSATVIDLIHRDEYDGVSSPKLPWTVAKDYTGATDVKLVIWLKGDPDTILKTAAAVVVSTTSITVAMTASFSTTLTFTGCPLTSEHEFALVATWPTSKPETIARGKAYIYDRAVPA